MKKFMAICMALVLGAATLTACGDDTKSATEETVSANDAAEETATEEVTEEAKEEPAKEE